MMGRRFLLLALAALPVLVPIAHAATLSGRVVGVTDGDTLTLLDGNQQQHKIRLAGIEGTAVRSALEAALG